MSYERNKQWKLYSDIKDVLECDEISLKTHHFFALKDATERLRRGYNITSEQSGYWTSVKTQVLNTPSTTFKDLFDQD